MPLNAFRRMLKERHRRARKPRRPVSPTLSPSLAELETRLLPAVTITIDYSFDVNNFFNTQAKRDLMKLAADTVAATLNDSLSALVPSGSNSWTAVFPNPANPSVNKSLNNPSVQANTLVVYVGGATISAAEAAVGSTGGYSASGAQAWLDAVATRGQSGASAPVPTDFGPWGGSIAFDNSGSINWYYGASLAGLGSTQTDFLSVAEHELGHVLGFGTADSWTAKVSGGLFQGATAKAYNGGQPVPLSNTGDHWAQSVSSDGGPALMDPVLVTGTRSLFTSLDYAALKDIGWQVTLPAPTAQFSASAYSVNENGGAATITVIRSGGVAATNVPYSTSNGTATAGTDYQTASGLLSFGFGELVKTFTIPIINDGLAEGNETVNLTLGTPSNGGALGSPATAVLTIIDSTTPSARIPAGDFDGDGKTDLGVFRPTTGQWFISQSTQGMLTPIPVFGNTSPLDVPLVGDFDGVGHAQRVIYRPSTAQWFVDGASGLRLIGTFGWAGVDVPVPADYDGDGRTEMAVYRPTTAQWFISGAGGTTTLGPFGWAGVDVPVPGDYNGDGRAEIAVYRPTTAQWFISGSGGTTTLGPFGWAGVDVPVPGDYDGLGRTELAVYRPSTAQWFVLGSSGSRVMATFGWTGVDLPMSTNVASLAKFGKGTSANSRSAALTVAAQAPESPLPIAPMIAAAPRKPAQWATALESWLAEFEPDNVHDNMT